MRNKLREKRQRARMASLLTLTQTLQNLRGIGGKPLQQVSWRTTLRGKRKEREKERERVEKDDVYHFLMSLAPGMRRLTEENQSETEISANYTQGGVWPEGQCACTIQW